MEDQLTGYSFQDYYKNDSFSGTITYDVMGNSLTYFDGKNTWSKKFTKKCREMNKRIRELRPYPVREIISRLNQMLTGYYHYYGITDNYDGIDRFYQETRRRLFYGLNRRGQRNSYTWKGFLDLLKRYPLVRPKLYVNIYDN